MFRWGIPMAFSNDLPIKVAFYRGIPGQAYISALS
jgi:hypothetical protein